MFEIDHGEGNKDATSVVGFWKNSTDTESYYSNTYMIYGVSGAYYDSVSDVSEDRFKRLNSYVAEEACGQDLIVTLGEVTYAGEDDRASEHNPSWAGEYNIYKPLYSSVRAQANSVIEKTIAGSRLKNAFDLKRNLISPETLAPHLSDLEESFGLSAGSLAFSKASDYELYTDSAPFASDLGWGSCLLVRNINSDSDIVNYTKELYLHVGEAYLSGTVVCHGINDLNMQSCFPSYIFGAVLGCYKIDGVDTIPQEDRLYMTVYKTRPILRKDAYVVS